MYPLDKWIKMVEIFSKTITKWNHLFNHSIQLKKKSSAAAEIADGHHHYETSFFIFQNFLKIDRPTTPRIMTPHIV